MEIIILGCGTSTGVPVIGCHCQVCDSTDPKNRRTRSSALVRSGGQSILIDTSTDLRLQALSNSIEKIDAVLFTHAHADHIHGIDDLRTFNMLQKGSIPCFGSETTMKRIKKTFDYIFINDGRDGWKPNLTANIVDSAFEFSGIEITPVEIIHGKAPIFGYRIGRAAYITDCSLIPESSVDKLKGVDVLVIGALRYKHHPTHFTVEQAIEASRKIGPKRTILTHLGHSLDYAKDNWTLPPGIELAYDGMRVEV